MSLQPLFTPKKQYIIPVNLVPWIPRQSTKASRPGSQDALRESVLIHQTNYCCIRKPQF